MVAKITRFPVELFLDRRFGNSVMLLAYSPSYGTLLVEPGSFPCQARESGYWDTLRVKLLKSDAPGCWFPPLSFLSLPYTRATKNCSPKKIEFSDKSHSKNQKAESS